MKQKPNIQKFTEASREPKRRWSGDTRGPHNKAAAILLKQGIPLSFSHPLHRPCCSTRGPCTHPSPNHGHSSPCTLLSQYISPRPPQPLSDVSFHSHVSALSSQEHQHGPLALHQWGEEENLISTCSEGGHFAIDPRTLCSPSLHVWTHMPCICLTHPLFWPRNTRTSTPSSHSGDPLPHRCADSTPVSRPFVPPLVGIAVERHLTSCPRWCRRISLGELMCPPRPGKGFASIHPSWRKKMIGVCRSSFDRTAQVPAYPFGCYNHWQRARPISVAGCFPSRGARAIWAGRRPDLPDPARAMFF
jgi:hypothetical protein